MVQLLSLCVHTVFGGETYGTSGQLASPNYPYHKYGHNLDIAWTIIAPIGQVITVTFVFFDVEYPFQDYGCVYDWVLVSSRGAKFSK